MKKTIFLLVFLCLTINFSLFAQEGRHPAYGQVRVINLSPNSNIVITGIYIKKAGFDTDLANWGQNYSLTTIGKDGSTAITVEAGLYDVMIVNRLLVDGETRYDRVFSVLVSDNHITEVILGSGLQVMPHSMMSKME